MNGEKRGLSLGTVIALVLTAVVILGCVVFFTAFKGEGDVAMSAQKMAGLLEEAMQTRTETLPATVRTVTVTLAPINTAPPDAEETPLS